MTRPMWASAVAAVGVAASGMLFLAGGSGVQATVALIVAAIFGAEAARRPRV